MAEAAFLDRLAETEYASFDDGVHATPTPFGTWVHHPEFPTRYDANQITRCVCPPGREADLLAELDRCYAGLGLEFKKVSGHDPGTFDRLRVAWPDWRFTRCAMLTFDVPPERASNAAVTVQAVEPGDPDLAALHDPADRGFAFECAAYLRLGGEFLVGLIDGSPAGAAGWYVVGGVARYRGVYTAPEFERRGVATTLVRHIQDHPAVRAADALVIFCGENLLGARRLYDRLGFRFRGWTWDGFSAVAP